jgi:hypothetical protein
VGGMVESDTASATTIDRPPPFFASSRSLPLTAMLVLVSVSSVAALVRHESGRARCNGVTRGGGAGGWEA